MEFDNEKLHDGNTDLCRLFEKVYHKWTTTNDNDDDKDNDKDNDNHTGNGNGNNTQWQLKTLTEQAYNIIISHHTCLYCTRC